MDDLEILKQLMNGNHLEPAEEERGKQLIKAFCVRLDIPLRWENE